MLWNWIKRILRLIIVFSVIIIMITNSGRPSLIFYDRVRVFTRQIEFDYVTWTINALWQKLSQAALGTDRYMTTEQQQTIVQDSLSLAEEELQLNDKINLIFSDPATSDPLLTAAPYLQRQRDVQEEMKHINLMSESVMQQQLSRVLATSGLTTIGQPMPPVQFHSTQLPYALIVSPRDTIRQDADISLLPDLTLDQITALEKSVETNLNVSALVVPVGGIGVYPTMVMETSNFLWLMEVIAHEWTHNFLTLHPLGLLYEKNAQMRIINETTASISGKELGRLALAQYYPQYLPKEETTLAKNSESKNSTTPEPSEPPAFDFRAAMHETRITADQLLAKGKIKEAENYMEQRRLVFVENGYNIRRLNQAYFAFYGAYADVPGGAAGQDPVGTAVRALRAESSNLTDFLHRIAWVTSFEDLNSLITTSK